MTKRPRRQSEPEFRRQLGLRVRQLRDKKEREWSQLELGRRLHDKSKMRVYRIERGEVPTELGLIEELAAVFDMEPIEFLAPILGAESDHLKQAQAARLQREAAELEVAIAEEFKESLDRPRVKSFVDQAVRAGRLMDDAQLGLFTEMFFAWRQRHGEWLDSVALLKRLQKTKKEKKK